jgi:hypothetical protein
VYTYSVYSARRVGHRLARVVACEREGAAAALMTAGPGAIRTRALAQPRISRALVARALCVPTAALSARARCASRAHASSHESRRGRIRTAVAPARPGVCSAPCLAAPFPERHLRPALRAVRARFASARAGRGHAFPVFVANTDSARYCTCAHRGWRRASPTRSLSLGA